MRFSMGLLAMLAVVPVLAGAQAEPTKPTEPTEQQKLAGFNYQLAVAEVPGDVHSDQLMARMLSSILESEARSGDATAPVSEPMRAFRARAQMVAAELEADVAAVRDADPFILGADLGCWPKGKDPETCSARRATLESLVGDNAYHGLVLMTYAWAADDAEGFLRAARLAAVAPDYDSLPAIPFDSLRDRYRQVPLPPMPAMGELARLHAHEVMAMSVAMAIALPPLQSFRNPCRASEGELRDLCLALALKMVAFGQNPVEVWIGQAVVEALGSPAQIEAAAAKRRETDWLVVRSLPLMAASEHGKVAGMEEYFAAFGSHGELGAMQALLQAHNIATVPPDGWTRNAATAADLP